MCFSLRKGVSLSADWSWFSCKETVLVPWMMKNVPLTQQQAKRTQIGRIQTNLSALRSFLITAKSLQLDSKVKFSPSFLSKHWKPFGERQEMVRERERGKDWWLDLNRNERLFINYSRGQVLWIYSNSMKYRLHQACAPVWHHHFTRLRWWCGMRPLEIQKNKKIIKNKINTNYTLSIAPFLLKGISFSFCLFFFRSAIRQRTWIFYFQYNSSVDQAPHRFLFAIKQ